MSNRRPCQFFLRGSCRFGDNCRDYHPKGALFDGSNQHSTFRSSGSSGLFGSNSSNTQNGSFNPFSSNKSQGSSGKLGISNGNPTLQTLELIGIVINSGVWPFGRIGLPNQTPVFASLDLSFEEYRFKFYQNSRSCWESLHFETLRMLNELYRNFIENGKSRGCLPSDHKLYNLDLSKYSKIGNLYLPNLGKEFVSSDNPRHLFENPSANSSGNSSFSSSVSTSTFPFSNDSAFSSGRHNPFSGNNNSTGTVFGGVNTSNTDSFFSGFSSNFGGGNSSTNPPTKSGDVFSNSNSAGNAFGGFSNGSSSNPFGGLNSFSSSNSNAQFSNSLNSNTQTTPFGVSQKGVFGGNTGTSLPTDSPFSTNQNSTWSFFGGNYNNNSSPLQQSPSNPFFGLSPGAFSDQKFSHVSGCSSETTSGPGLSVAPVCTKNTKYSFRNPDVNDETLIVNKQELLLWERDAFVNKSFENSKIPEKIPPRSLRT
ncbi:zinc finger protein [Cryptosporidium ryanae]|uniref:zinc finger protein n=1 Tax=Cryptosporidium ryanae TaxID=515981 RepID=UPI00351A907B|nr:zinc finger protein [Cryptosporidium ryanae]